MRNKMRIIALFVLLALAPFQRGCGYTYGFPAPMVVCENKSSYEDSNLICAFFEKLSSEKFVADHRRLLTYTVLTLDVILMLLTALLILRRKKELKWLFSFLNALAITVCAQWLSWVSLRLGETNIDIIKNIAEYIGLCVCWFSITIPGNIKDFLTRKDFSPDVDVITRAWFVSGTFILAGIIYCLIRGIELYRRKKGKGGEGIWQST